MVVVQRVAQRSAKKRKPSLRKIVTKDAYKGCCHQALKAINKNVKLIKAFLLQKIVRKIKKEGELETESVKEQIMTKKIEVLKSLNHNAAAKYIATYQLNIHDTSSLDDGIVDEEFKDDSKFFIDEIMKHKKMIETISEWKQKLADSQVKNIRKKIAQTEHEGKKFNNLIKQRSFGLKERTGAIFLDSLEDDNNDFLLEENEKKAVRKEILQSKKKSTTSNSKMKNKPPENAKSPSSYNPATGRMDGRKQDLSIYMPTSERPDESKRENSDEDMKKMADRSDPSSSASTRRSDKKYDSSIDVNIETVKSGKDWKEHGMHPSWAAKKLNKQMSGIVPGAVAMGKKIVFDD